MRTEAGENYNKGVDGVTPLIAGICSKEQEKTVVKAPEICRGTVVPGWNFYG